MLKLTFYLNQNTSLYKMEKFQVISKEFKKCLFSVMVLFFVHFLNDCRKEWARMIPHKSLIKSKKNNNPRWFEIVTPTPSLLNDVSKFIVSNFQSRLTTSSKHVHSEPHHFDCTSVFTRSVYYGLADKMLNVIIKYTNVNQQQRGRE